MKRKLPVPVVFLGLVALGACWKFIPMEDAAERLDAIATQGLNFSSREIPVSQAEKEKLGGAQAIKRLYSHSGSLFSFTCIDGSRHRNAVHDPSYCLIARGWTVKSERELALGSGCGNLVTLEREGQKTEMLYWFSDEADPFHSMPRYWIQSTFRRLTRGWFGSEPIQVVVRPLDPSGQFDWMQFSETVLPKLNIR